MMLAGQARARRVGQHLAHDRAQRVLNEQIVADVDRSAWAISPGQPGSGTLTDDRASIANRGAARRKWRLLLPGASGPRLEVQTPRT